MKKQLLLTTLLLMAGLSVSAQSSQRMMQRKDERHKSKSRSCPRAYLGFSTGINNPVGIIGPQVDLAVSPKVSVGTGVGLSSWGTKTFMEARYYFGECNKGWAIGGGFTYNTGLQNAEFPNTETIYGQQTVRINGKAQGNFMFSGYYFVPLGHAHRNRFHVQAGYSVPLSAKHYDQIYGPEMTQTSKDAMLLIAPGGLIIGVGFSFGLGNM